MTPNPNPSPELKPCPFCGGEAETDRYGPDEAAPEMAINCRGECDGIFVFPDIATSDYAGLRHVWNTRASQTLPAPGEVEDPDHQYAVVSADYRRPFLAGAYATLEAALLAQDGKPDRWHIYHRLAATVANDEGVARIIDPEAFEFVPDTLEIASRQGRKTRALAKAAAIRLLSQGGGK